MTPRIPQARISQHDARPETSWYAGRRIRMWCGLTRARRVGVAVLLLALLGPCACGADEAQLTVLTNGLRVLTQEVHSAPVVSVYMWYRAGSRDEHTGITGISHFVEHMMFKGTARFGPGEISRLVTRTGGWDNGYTWLDYTAYVETLPAKHLDLALRIEADRMANAAFAAKDVDSERTVVLSELEGHENDPGFHLSNEVRAAAFTAHPYQWPIIGWKSDVAAYDRDKAAAYYRAHYAPNNATLVVVGDFNRDDVLRRVRSLFGRIPRGSAVRDGVTEEPPQRGERRVVVRRPGGAGMIQMAFHVPAANHPDHYALDIAETVLGTGRTSRLYQALVAKQLAVNADAYNFTNRDPTLFAVYVTLAPGADHVDAEQAVLAEIDRLSSELISERELQRAKNQAKAAFVYGTDSVSKLANMLGFFDVIGNYRLLYDYVDRIEGVTREQVQEAARRYLDADNRTVGWFVPTDEGPAGRPSGPGPLMRSGGIPRASVAAAGGNRREGEPSSGAATATAERPANVGRREPTRIELDNGATFIVYENPVVPAISIEGMVGGGMIFDPADKPGLSTFTAQMLSRGAAGRSYQEIADDLEFAAATIGVGGGIQVGNISGRCLKDDLPLVMRTLADQVRRPDFPEDQIALVRSQLEVALREAAQDTGEVAEREFYAALYPDGHPLHHPRLGTLDAVGGITRDDLVAFHGKYYRPDTLVLAVVGDVSEAQVRELAEECFGDWQASGERPPIAIPDVPPPAEVVRKSITLPGKTQSDIAIGFPGISRLAPDYHAAELLNYVLGGGGFTSRLTNRIRDEQGLAYYVYSYFAAYYGAGPWMLRMGVNPGRVEQAIDSALSELRRIGQEPPGTDEVRLWQDYVTGTLALRLETNAGIGNSLSTAEFYGLGLDYPWRYPEIMATLTPADVAEAARKYITPDRAAIVVAGPEAPR